jgi:hypothetical protein
MEFEVMSQTHISGSLIHHSGHSLTIIVIVGSLNLIHRNAAKYYTIKSGETPEGLGKGKKSEN